MAVMKRTTSIPATVEEVWDYATDMRMLTDWYTGLETIQDMGANAAFPQVGSRFGANYHAAGLQFQLTCHVTNHRPHHALEFDIEGDATGYQLWEVSEDDDTQGTRVTVTLEYRIPGGDNPQVMDRILLEQMNIQQLEDALNNLRTFFEREAPL